VIEIGAFLIAAPLLIIPNRFTIFALALLPFVWLARLIARQRTLRRSPADWPLLGLLVMTSVSLYPSIDLNLSRPKLDGLLLCLYFFTVLVEHFRRPSWEIGLAGFLVIGGTGVALAGLVGIDWFQQKLPRLGPLYGRLPHLVTAVPTSFGTVDSGFHPNEIAGTLALLLPVAIALALGLPARIPRLAAGGSALIMFLTLGLSLSRSALVGVVVAVLALVVWRWRRAALVLPAVTIVIVGVAAWSGPGRVVDWLLAMPTASTVGAVAAGRSEIWDRAFDMIQDFPLTGIGLNTFPVVADLLYPMFVNGPNARVPHAHDLFLQTAVDLGLPGLLSFVGLLTVAGLGLVRAWPGAVVRERALLAGLAAGLVGHLVFGLTDAVTLGAKPGVFLWAVLGGAVALGLSAGESAALPVRPPDGGSVARVVLGVGVLQWLQWALFSLACALGIVIAVSGLKMLP
jgi:putative inorganic carbon (HCO3(-)) transporter